MQFRFLQLLCLQCVWTLIKASIPIPSACTMAFGDISYLGTCAEILNLKAQTFLAAEQLASQDIIFCSLLSN